MITDDYIMCLWRNPTKGPDIIHTLRAIADDAVAIYVHEARKAQEPVCYAHINKHGDVKRTAKQKDRWCSIPLYSEALGGSCNENIRPELEPCS